MFLHLCLVHSWMGWTNKSAPVFYKTLVKNTTWTCEQPECPVSYITKWHWNWARAWFLAISGTLALGIHLAIVNMSQDHYHCHHAEEVFSMTILTINLLLSHPSLWSALWSPVFKHIYTFPISVFWKLSHPNPNKTFHRSTNKKKNVKWLQFCLVVYLSLQIAIPYWWSCWFQWWKTG